MNRVQQNITERALKSGLHLAKSTMLSRVVKHALSLFNPRKMLQSISLVGMVSLGSISFAAVNGIQPSANPLLRGFKGDSLTYQGLTFFVVEKEEDDDDDYDESYGYYFTVEESMLGHTNFRLTTAIGTEIGDLPGQIVLNKNGVEIFGLELNGGILNISGQAKPTDNSNIQTLGSLLIRKNFDPGDGFITVKNRVRVGDWFETLDIDRLEELDNGSILKVLRVRDISKVNNEDISTLYVQNSYGEDLKQLEIKPISNSEGDVVADATLRTGFILEKDPTGGENNYVAARSLVTLYDIHDNQVLDLTVSGVRDFRSLSDIVGNGDLTIDVKNREVTLAGSQYDWKGSTYLKGTQAGTIVLENSLAQGDLIVENITLDLNGQTQRVSSLTSHNGVIDLNEGHLILNLTAADRSQLSGLEGKGILTIASGEATAEDNQALTADIRILEDASLQFTGDDGFGYSDLNLAGSLDLNGTDQIVKSLYIAPTGRVYNSQINDYGVAKASLGTKGAVIENAGKIIVGSSSNRTVGSQLTIEGDYRGLGGELYMNAHIDGADHSIADKVVIQGRADGETIVYVDVSGPGGYLGAKDLMLIETDSSTDNAFTAANDIFVGSYQYYLRREDDQNWYLSPDQIEICPRSSFSCSLVDNKPEVDENKNDGTEEEFVDENGPYNKDDDLLTEDNEGKIRDDLDHQFDNVVVNRKPKVKLNYRPDIGTNLANTDGALYNQIPGLGGVGGFGSPIAGVERYEMGNNISIWNVTKGSKLYGRALDDTLRFNNEHYNTTIGMDKLFSLDGGGNLRVGAMITVMRSTTHSKNHEIGSTSKGRVTGPSFGLYGTWYADSKDPYSPYLDGIISYGRYHNRVETHNNPVATYRSHLWSLTLQGGYPLEVGDNMILEPQGQLTYLSYKANEYDYVGGVHIKNSTKGALVGRVGLFAYSSSKSLTPYAGVNIWYDGVKSRTRFNSDLYEGNHKGLSVEIKAGIVSNSSSKRSTTSIEAFYRKGSKGIKDYGGSFSWRYEL